MATWSWFPPVSRIRRLLTVGAIATANIHKCFHGLEPFMLAPPGYRRYRHHHDCYDCYDELHYNQPAEEPAGRSDPAESTKDPWKSEPASIQIESPAPVNHQEPAPEAEDIAEVEDTTISDVHTHNLAQELKEDQPIESQFGPIGDQTHRYVSQHMGGPLPILAVDEPSYFYLLTTYLSYMILNAFGHTRDFFGKRFKPDKYKDYRERDGYAPLNSDFENFYFRRLKKRMDHCFSRPITGVPGRYITLMNRVSHDYLFSCGQLYISRDRKNYYSEEHQNPSSLFICKQTTSTLNYATTIMLEDTTFDSTDKGTLRPNAKLLHTKEDTFTPIQLLNFS